MSCMYYDANVLYEAGTKVIRGDSSKRRSKNYRVHQLLLVSRLQNDLLEDRYRPSQGSKKLIRERGKARYITDNNVRDKTINHVISDEFLTKYIDKYLIYDNGASRINKGVSHHRRRLVIHLNNYYRRTGSNQGYILLSDFSGYYPNIWHDKCIEIIKRFLNREVNNPVDCEYTMRFIKYILEQMEIDVSRFSDEEIDFMYNNKVDPMINEHINKRLLTGDKFLKKGIDIGNQISQNIGIIYAYRIDNYVKIVRGIKEYGRYTDDTYLISDSKEELLDIFENVKNIADEFGIIINTRKTRICKIDKWFRILQVNYRVNPDGSIPRKIHPKSMTRERRRLKTYKEKLDNSEMDYEKIENCFKSWIGIHYKIMSRQQIDNMFILYYQLFERRPKWKKKHGRLRWLMEQSLKGLD